MCQNKTYFFAYNLLITFVYNSELYKLIIANHFCISSVLKVFVLYVQLPIQWLYIYYASIYLTHFFLFLAFSVLISSSQNLNLSSNTMAALGNRGTVTEASGFKPEEDAQKLHNAMKGAGTNEATIIEILAHRTIAQRQKIKEAFKQSVGKDLLDCLKSELTGNFEKVVVGLMMSAPVYDAYELRNAIKGAGTEEACLIDILASRSNAEKKEIIATYKKEHGKSLEDDVCGDTSGMFQRVLVSLLAAGRDESTKVDEAQAVQDAKDIYEAGEARWGTDEVKFLTVLSVRNRNHLLRVFQEYQKISGRDIEDSIKREMSGCLEDVFLAIVKCMKNKPAFFAERLYKSMKGLGTTDSVLIRIMVARAEIDMLDIKAEFLKMYGKTLHSFIKGDTSGDYRKILLELCGGEK
uniref:Annexin n=4 Tax=Cyprinus carpio TaxID=7962 RepID=A0A9J7YTF1_CYPCA